MLETGEAQVDEVEEEVRVDNFSDAPVNSQTVIDLARYQEAVAAFEKIKAAGHEPDSVMYRSAEMLADRAWNRLMGLNSAESIGLQ